MKSRDEFVISQGWGTSSGLQALARIQLPRRRETHQADVPLIEVDANDTNVDDVADEIGKSVGRS